MNFRNACREGVKVGLKDGRVLFFDDGHAVRYAIETSFRDEGLDVYCVSEGRGLEQILTTFQADIAILDVRRRAGPDTYATVRELRNQYDIPIVLLSSANSLDDRLSAFRAGADDYLTKPFSMAELVARAKALLRRSGRLPGSTFHVGDIIIDDASRVVTRGDVALELTRTEFDILSFLGRHQDQVFSKERILKEVWGCWESQHDSLVAVHVCALRRKLEAHGPRVLHTVRQVGYYLGDAY